MPASPSDQQENPRATTVEGIAPIRQEASASTNPLAFRHDGPNRIVLGKTMSEQLRFTVCCWHSVC